jgi:hypothetical protein
MCVLCVCSLCVCVPGGFVRQRITPIVATSNLARSMLAELVQADIALYSTTYVRVNAAKPD